MTLQEVQLLADLYRTADTTLEPYRKLLGDGMDPIDDLVFETIDKVGVYFGWDHETLYNLYDCVTSSHPLAYPTGWDPDEGPPYIYVDTPEDFYNLYNTPI